MEKRISRRMCFEYAEDYDLDYEQAEDLWYYIQRMDADFIPWWLKRQPKPKAPKAPRGK